MKLIQLKDELEKTIKEFVEKNIDYIYLGYSSVEEYISQYTPTSIDEKLGYYFGLSKILNKIILYLNK